MFRFRETEEKEVTVGFRVPEYVIDVVDILCRSEDLNRSQILSSSIGFLRTAQKCHC
jgi:hypothetical protein